MVALETALEARALRATSGSELFGDPPLQKYGEIHKSAGSTS
jgi:hypothetical protein